MSGQVGRPPLDPHGSTAVRIPAVRLAPHQAARLAAVVARLAAWQGVSGAAARRHVMMAGVDAVEAGLDAARDLMGR